MTAQDKPSHLATFLSLNWYETMLLFVANFVAKSSELLLTAGLVVSSANFLTDGSMLQKGTPFAIAWAWTQAIAIDGSLGISFYSVFQSVKQHDWIKCVLYGILTILLTLVALFITEGDILSHAMNTSPHEAMSKIGMDVQVLSSLRAIAVVGFVLMSRLREVPLQQSFIPTQTSISHAIDVAPAILLPTDNKQKHISAGDLEPTTHVISEVQPSTSTPTEMESHKQAVHIISQHMTPANTEPVRSPSRQTDLLIASDITKQMTPYQPELQSQEEMHSPAFSNCTMNDIATTDSEKLLQAYLSLKEEGVKISGRLLAQRAHMRRSTCTAWLKTYHGNDDSIASEQTTQEAYTA